MFKKYINKTVTLLLPASCPICWSTILQYPDLICDTCKALLPKEFDPAFRSIFSARDILSCSKNTNLTKKTIKLFKYGRKQAISLFIPLIKKTALTQHDHFSNIDIILPVPIHRKRYKQRGFNQNEVIAEKLSYIIKKPMLTGCLVKTKNTVSQTGLSSSQRIHNLKKAFTLQNSHKLEKKNILLVDDIITTGATMETCSRELVKAGAKKIKGFTIAYTT
jgi:ComF family protein